MNDATLAHFRQIAEDMREDAPHDWQWIGNHQSQRMFEITEDRAKSYAARHGGTASREVVIPHDSPDMTDDAQAEKVWRKFDSEQL